MDVGVCLPYMKQGLDRATLLGFARAVEAGPFASLSCGERITGPTVDLGLTMAAAAAVTSRVRIVPTLYVLPLHDAVKAAKEIATLDVLSGGRTAVTIGVGGRPNDYRAVSAPFERRHVRMDEQVATLRRIWRGEPPFEGADPVGPAPVRAGGPPIYAGVMGPKATARAARWADGVYVWSGNGVKSEIAHLLAQTDRAWEAAKRAEPPRRIGGFWYSLAAKDPLSEAPVLRVRLRLVLRRGAGARHGVHDEPRHARRRAPVARRPRGGRLRRGIPRAGDGGARRGGARRGDRRQALRQLRPLSSPSGSFGYFGGIQHARSHASSLSFLRSVEKPRAFSSGQNFFGLPLYSVENTALPAAITASSASHSSYWKHCSLRFQSKAAMTSASVVSMPFFWPTLSPRACACAATSRYHFF